MKKGSQRNNMLLMNENEKCLCNNKWKKESCNDAPDSARFKHMHEFISMSLHHRCTFIKSVAIHRNVNWCGGDDFISLNSLWRCNYRMSHTIWCNLLFRKWSWMEEWIDAQYLRGGVWVHMTSWKVFNLSRLFGTNTFLIPIISDPIISYPLQF